MIPRRHRCADCGKAYRDAASLMQHQLKEHGHEGYDCRMCDVTLPDMESMRAHIQRAHPFRRREPF